MVVTDVEDTCRRNGRDRVTVEELERIRAWPAWLYACTVDPAEAETMDLTTGLLLGVGLFLLILVPYLVLEVRRGKAHGHTWFTWFKPRGHSDIGPDVGVRYTKPGIDEARGARH